MSLSERSRRRRAAMEVNRAASFAEAEVWDLDFWQRRTPEERLSALVAIQRDVALAEAARDQAPPVSGQALDTVTDFEDILVLLAQQRVRYLIVGGLAFIFHAKPRYTKDIDLWIDPEPENVERANRALAELGSPALLAIDRPDEILQIGAAPNRIGFSSTTVALSFAETWPRRVEGRYGAAPANWIDLESLLAIKSAIDHPRHQEDARVLRAVLARRQT